MSIEKIFTIVIMITGLGYVFPRSKIVAIIEACTISLIVGGYNGNIDLVSYRNRYEYEFVSSSLTERVYDLTARLSHQAGISFEAFHFFISTICISIILYVALKLSPQPAFIMSLMMGFSTLEYAIQIQTLCASAFVILAIYFLCGGSKKYKDKKPIVIFVFFITMATGYHFTSIFYLLLIVIPYIKKENIKYYLIFAIISIFIIIQYGGELLLNYGAIRIYLENFRRPEVFLGMAFWHVTGTYIVFRMYKQLDRLISLDPPKYSALTGHFGEITYLYKGTLLVCITILFYMVTTVATRIPRTWSFFYYIIASYIPRNKHKVSIWRMAIILYSIGSLILFYVILSQGLIKEILLHNIFWSL